MEILISIICFILFVFFMFRQDTKEAEEKVKSQGGIEKKYKEFISYFDNFDLYNKPKIIKNEPNYYQIAWGGSSTICHLTLFELLDNIYIEFEMRNNKDALKRKGIDINSVPNLNRKLDWKFSNETNQREMANIICLDLDNLIKSLY